MSNLSHFDDRGASRMVDTGGKPETERVARASGRIRAQPATIALIRDKGLSKGDVREVARLAGIMAAKKTAELIPLCHQLPLMSVAVEFGDRSHGKGDRPYGCRNGSPDRRKHSRPDRLRYVQSGR
jgi:cyclic pyranopterin phosphate synthase